MRPNAMFFRSGEIEKNLLWPNRVSEFSHSLGQKRASTAIMRLSALLPIAGIGPRLRTVFQDGRTAAFEKKPAKAAGQV